MKLAYAALAASLTISSVGVGVFAATNFQTPAAQNADTDIKAGGVIGEVAQIDATARQLTVKTSAGSVVTVQVSDATSYQRLAPGETTLANATKITLADLGVGDRVWARGKVAADRKSVPATAVIVMSKGDIVKKQEAERAEWRRRGILGVVTAVKPEAREITISSRTMMGLQSVIVSVAENSDMRRYAPDSIKFSDASLSDFSEVKVGDQLRALGERNPDGMHFAAERVVTGSFQTVAGVVTEVDPATGVLKINDLDKKQALTIVIKQDSVLRKFPAATEMGAMMMARPGAAGGPPPQGQSGQTPPPGGAAGGPRPGGGGFNMQEMLERLPTIPIADVKVGDTIIVSSTKGADPSRLTAITLVSGADTLLNLLAARQQQTGGQQTPNPAAGLSTSGIQFGIGFP